MKIITVAREGDLITKNDSVGRHPWLRALGIQNLVNCTLRKVTPIVNKHLNKGHFWGHRMCSLLEVPPRAPLFRGRGPLFGGSP